MNEVSDIIEKNLGAQVDFLLDRHYRRLGKVVLVLTIPAVLLFHWLAVHTVGANSAYWDEWGLYLIHTSLSLGLYLILFSKEKNEDEFYLSLRLRSIARGVIMVFSAVALLPFFFNLVGLVIGRSFALPNVGGNMAVCTLLLFYANMAYLYNKSQIAKDD